jgi:hypothetical protein
MGTMGTYGTFSKKCAINLRTNFGDIWKLWEEHKELMTNI